MCRTMEFFGSLAVVVLVATTAAFAGKPQPPPPPPPPEDPAITWRTSDYSIMIANADGSSPYVLLAPINIPSNETGRASRTIFSRHSRPSWSPDGQWIAFSSDMPARPPNHSELNATGSGIYMITRDGSFLCKVVGTPDTAGNGLPVAWSPVIPPGASGYKLAYNVLEGPRPCPNVCNQLPCCQYETYLVDAICGATVPPVNITNTPSLDEYEPAWSPDARRIAVTYQDLLAYCCDDVHRLAIYDVSGNTATFSAELGLPPGMKYSYSRDWSRHGDAIAVHAGDGWATFGIWAYYLSGGGWTKLAENAADDARMLHPTWSPDDSQILFDDGVALWIVDATPGATPRLFLRDPSRRPLGYSYSQWRRF
jgi:Tol biopolymer transport system component